MKKRRLKIKNVLLYSVLLVFFIFIGNLSIRAIKDSLLVDGYQFVVDGEVWFMLGDQEELNKILTEYQDSYKGGIGSGVTITEVGFVQDVQIVTVRTEEEKLNDIATAKEKIYENDKEAVYYTVEPGDNLWDISQNLSISFYEFVNLNCEIDVDKIWPGDELLLEPKDPKLDVYIKLKSTVLESIPYTTHYIEDDTLYSTQRTVVSAGVEGEKNVTYAIKMLNGYEDETIVLDELILTQPIEAVVKRGTKRTLSIISSNDFGVVKGRRTSGYGWRTDPISGKKTFHDGIDIAADYGSAVYAYAGGTVSESGWNSIRGNYIIINHGNGLTTRYLHLSKRLVDVGDRVDVGDKIGQVGSTGYSTGNHLHFGVKLYGESQNPYAYL